MLCTISLDQKVVLFWEQDKIAQIRTVGVSLLVADIPGCSFTNRKNPPPQKFAKLFIISSGSHIST